MQQWQPVSADSLLIEHVGDCCAVYSGATGDTHLLDALPVEVLRFVIDSAPCSVVEIAALIADVVDEPADAWVVQVSEVLQRLRALQLVEHVPH
ncbi:MAG: hypothetical protein CME43_15150 [Haliea sp.]|jgi:PqqD family protein of HPr-rel-A system|uniref:HPr-rel-A system PqqD family peptide chaperone n=1 Tax=Haliea sp. TaxID=1932666 RepID=UPI000C3F564D|nr:HPr-rel-A system PqqD family peptide chaperone [Haliea sp.]MBM70805.1 hypothetical protein [Haliea sp.]|tara:strand:- start:38440 stop:38721 length:282 start_codon:yes stop_codon:yes gene_type:complete